MPYKDPEKQRNYMREYMRDYMPKWQAANPEYMSEYALKWQAENPAYQRERYAANPEKGRAVGRINGQRRRAREKNSVVVPYTPHEEQVHIEYFGGVCAYCDTLVKTFPKKDPLDHFIPIVKGGADALYNLVPSCVPCNSRKNDKDPEVFVKCPERLARIKKLLQSL